MQTILIDFETTGLDTATERIIEIGAQVVDEKWEVQEHLSVLINGEDFPPLTADIQRITGITQDELHSRGFLIDEAYAMLDDLLAPEISYAIAFNSVFDEGIFKAESARLGLHAFDGIAHLLQMPWLCAMSDIESNYQFKSWKLAHLALEYKVPVDPNILHRAINDVNLMRQMLKATGTSPTEMFTFRNMPWVFLRALIPAPWEDGGKGKEAASKRGYSWEKARGTDGPKFEKAWVKRVKASQVQAETQDAPFKVREIKGV